MPPKNKAMPPKSMTPSVPIDTNYSPHHHLATSCIAHAARVAGGTGQFEPETTRVMQQTDAEWLAEFCDNHEIGTTAQNLGSFTDPSATMRPSPKGMVHKNTLKSAVHSPTESGVLLCPEFNTAAHCRINGCGLGAMVRKAIGVTGFTFLTPSPPDARKNASSGFSIQSGMETMKSTTTGASAQTTPTSGNTTKDHTSLSFVKVEYKGPRKQRLTDWFAVPDEDYCSGNARGYRVAAEMMAWLQSQPATYEIGMIVREIMGAAFAVLAQPHTQDKQDKRGCAVTLLDAMAECVMFTAKNGNHQAYLEGKAQHSEDWAKKSAEMDAERNRATGRRLAAARKAKREARMAEGVVKV